LDQEGGSFGSRFFILGGVGIARLSADVGQPTDEPQSQVDIASAVLWVELFEIKNINMNIMFN